MSEEKKATKYRPLCASDIMNKGHELYKSFVSFCGDNEPSKRQARKFLQKYPQYRDVVVEV
jgi:hypothetical protein